MYIYFRAERTQHDIMWDRHAAAHPHVSPDVPSAEVHCRVAAFTGLYNCAFKIGSQTASELLGQLGAARMGSKVDGWSRVVCASGLYCENSPQIVEDAGRILGLSLNTVFTLQLPAGNPDELAPPFPGQSAFSTLSAQQPASIMWGLLHIHI